MLGVVAARTMLQVHQSETCSVAACSLLASASARCSDAKLFEGAAMRRPVVRRAKPAAALRPRTFMTDWPAVQLGLGA